MKNFENKIILASQSPRRKDIMAMTPWEFEVEASDVDETMDENLDLETNLKLLSEKKADPIAEKYPNNVVIGSDTIVYAENRVLGKPKDDEEAAEMLRLFSGKSHYVYTGVCILHKASNKKVAFCERTKVTFKTLTEDEIAWYISTKEHVGKAGAYAVQGPAGMLITGIEGDYFNVVGLPLNRVYEELSKFEI